MKKFIFALFILISSPTWSFTKLDLCEIHGFFQGNNEEFLSELAASYLHDNGFIVSGQCDTLRVAGFQTAQKASQANRPGWTSAELETIKKMNLFKRKIMQSILKSSNIEIN